MKTNELGFLQNNPGAVKHGNFINYYSFNSVQSRLECLDYKMFPLPKPDRLFVLDVGCNSGDLTSSLSLYLQERYEGSSVHILALDIDPILISKARELNHKSSHIEFEVGNIMDDHGRNIVQQFLEKHGRQHFDFTFCFSVTMWIHLNNGDEGLLDFLKYIQGVSTSFIIEPQPWKCYRSAQKRLRKAGSSFKNYDSLQIRGHVDSEIEETIIKGGVFRKTFETGLTGWGRKVQCYCSNDIM